MQTSIDNNTPYAKLTDKYQSVEATPLQINNNDSSEDSKTDSNGANYTEDDLEVHSTIGSTVSVMGSVVGDDEDDSSDNKYDAKKLLEVKLRMMRDVQEVVEEDEQEGALGPRGEGALEGVDVRPGLIKGFPTLRKVLA